MKTLNRPRHSYLSRVRLNNLTCSGFLFFIVLSLAHPASAERLSVKIEGVDDELLDNINNTLSIVKEQKDSPSDQLTERAIKRAHSQASKQIKQALRPFGFYEPRVNSQLSREEQRWVARYLIEKGPQTLIRQVTIEIKGEGQQEKSLQQLIEKPSIKVGDALNHQQYTNYKQALYNSLFEAGYIDAQYLKSEMRVNIRQQQADIILVIDSGLQYFFGDLTIEQSIIDDDKINRLITTDRNTPFNTDRLLELQLKLSDTGYFASTDISIERDKTVNQRIPVKIIATPSKKLKYSTSLGYGTDTGGRLGFSLLNRRVNKKGHRLQYSFQLSEVENNFTTQYIIPIDRIHADHIDLFGNVNQEVINDVDATQYTVGTSINQGRWGGRRKLSLTLLEERFSFDDSNQQTANLLIPGLIYHYKKADNTLFSRRGYSFTADIHGGIESSISETTFFHSRLNGRAVFPVSSRSRLLSRLEFGAILSDEFDELPPSERFFTGGAQSVRGYDYKDIGTRDSAGNNIGGEYLFAGSIEMDYLAWGNIGFAVFYDAGDAADDTAFTLKKSAGLGLRYRSAIGMIRLDFAHPFDDPDESFRFHISIGPDL